MTALFDNIGDLQWRNPVTQSERKVSAFRHGDISENWKSQVAAKYNAEIMALEHAAREVFHTL